MNHIDTNKHYAPRYKPRHEDAENLVKMLAAKVNTVQIRFALNISRFQYDRLRDYCVMTGLIPPTKPDVWKTPGNVETVTRLWMEGFTGGQVARMMKQGITRGAVIGKVNRMKLKRPPKEKRVEVVKPPRKYVPHKPFNVRWGQAVTPTPSRVPLPEGCQPAPLTMRTNKGCNYPVTDGNVKMHLYCNMAATKHGDSWYCGYHKSVMYGRPEKLLKVEA
jgi:GcrA cell cycle regulator